MAVWAAVLGLLGFNYHQHRHGRPTFCSFLRAVVCRIFRKHPRAGFTGLLALFLGWFWPHITRPMAALIDAAHDTEA